MLRLMTLTPVTRPGGVKAVVIPTDASRAYVVEARQPVGRDAAIFYPVEDVERLRQL